VGAPDPQPAVPQTVTGFFWQWTPLNFADRSIFFHVNADPDGRPWNTRAVILPDGAGPDAGYETSACRMEDVELVPGTRHARTGALVIPLDQGEARVGFEPFLTFLMRGIGYGGEWRHGGFKGQLAVGREDIRLDQIDMTAPENWHIQALSRVTLETPGEPPQQGLGVFEQLIAGPYRPYRL
jgi:hypothetical protein